MAAAAEFPALGTFLWADVRILARDLFSSASSTTSRCSDFLFLLLEPPLVLRPFPSVFAPPSSDSSSPSVPENIVKTRSIKRIQSTIHKYAATHLHHPHLWRTCWAPLLLLQRTAQIPELPGSSFCWRRRACPHLTGRPLRWLEQQWTELRKWNPEVSDLVVHPQ